MLTYLQIRDFAIIDAIELELHPGLTVLTGETGAGKSILVDALQLLAGGRAGAEVVRHGAERAEITGTFDLTRTPRELKRWLEEQSISGGEELSIRRVVSSDGRSRAYLNGQAVALTSLREAGNILIDIHGQHEFQSLTRSAAQRELLDGYGRLEPAAGQVGIAHRVWLELLNRTLELEGKARDRDARLELLRYQVSELKALQLKAGEFESLVDEHARLANRGKLAEATQTALQLLYEGEQGSAHAGVSRALQALRGLEAVDPKLGAMLPFVEEAAIQIREAARELSHYRDGLELDTTRQDEVERRLAAIEELARKNRVTPLELAARTAELVSELETVERADMDLAVLRKDLAAALEEFRTLAAQLSAKRTTAGRALAKDITTRMQTLGMSGGRFQVEVSQDGTADPAQHGVDQIEFRVTANPGQPLRALAKVASGGELSRLSLAVQVSCAARETRCMIFDEVDSGIGGAVAEIVGRELRALGESGQVLCVTHLPQVASQGHHHLRVAKSTDGRTTRTALTELAPQDRVGEIARMLGGIEVTGKAREHAREMLRTHVDLPPDPSPTDKMPALTAKDLLAQAKIAARSGKEAPVEAKDLGVDPRATAAELSKAAAAKPGKVAAQPVKAVPQAIGGTPQPGKGAGPTTAAGQTTAAGPTAATGPTTAAAQTGAAAQTAKGTPQAAGDGAQPGKATDPPMKAVPEAPKAAPQPTKSAGPATKASAGDNVIDLAAKAAARPGAKRR
ncbi:MAG: recombination and repair protein [Gammaproteobacteria bacterium]|nr:recombination and repair protein [Gammaproteobacteria bacterium]